MTSNLNLIKNEKDKEMLSTERADTFTLNEVTSEDNSLWKSQAVITLNLFEIS
jgi:hypothetical protein